MDVPTPPAADRLLAQAHEIHGYPAMSHPLADPARFTVAARLAGLAPRHPATARILELGCASGHHLIPLAIRWPDAQFIGVERDAALISRARAAAAAASLTNIDFVHADLLTWQPPDQRFDHIIAYGLLSWVPDLVKSRLLEICRTALVADGIALIGMNAAEGWAPRLNIVRRCREILTAGPPAASHIPLLASLRQSADPSEAAIIDDMMAKGEEILRFDDFAPINDPWSASEFQSACSAAGLSWRADASPAADPAGAPATHRAALVTHSRAVLHPVSTQALLDVAISLPAGESASWLDDFPLVRRALEAAGQSAHAIRDLARDVSPAALPTLARLLLAGIAAGRLRARIEPLHIDPTPPLRPILSPFRLHCARHALPLVDAWHIPCRFSPSDLEILAKMDGTTGRAALVREMTELRPDADFSAWLSHLAARGMFSHS